MQQTRQVPVTITVPVAGACLSAFSKHETNHGHENDKVKKHQQPQGKGLPNARIEQLDFGLSAGAIAGQVVAE